MRAVVAARAGDDAAGRGIDDVARGVDGCDRAGDQAVDRRLAGRAEAALHRAFGSQRLADGRAHAGADVALGGRRRAAAAAR